jgi:hypothetical protein
MHPGPASSDRRAREGDTGRGVESLLWLAAGAAWAIVALRAWRQSKKVERKRKTFAISERLLKQVFPRGIHS